MEKYGRARQATDMTMCFAWWITKATDTRSEYVIFIAFPRQHGYANVPQCYVHTYIACLIVECFQETEKM